MNQQKYNHMVEMLIAATMSKKISWQEDAPHNAFITEINGCNVTVYSVYDIEIEESSYSLSLSNPNHEVFSTFSFSESTDKDDYNKLKSLYYAIRDVVYRITESENMILQGLENALASTDKISDLPF